ncbi:dienelactone hydrolase family protein [Flaviaesturariibacter amylovorans]|uniref:Dienelactone hydrolase family protein n=1 Tax=Flaviaesturariibacter amylovorans TaxID=1084520 RepID=A0ABP8GVA9_9BACT
MKTIFRIGTGCLLAAPLFLSCSGSDRSTGEGATTSSSAARPAAIREEAVTITAYRATLQCFLYTDSANKSPRPAVIVIPEWWGLNDYAKGRARQLAGLGYTALALDMYGNGQVAADPKAAIALATPFYTDPAKGSGRLAAALEYLKGRPETDTARTGAMGYCFGGTMALLGARSGLPFAGVVSFHGDFPEGPWPRDAYRGNVLICHGAADSMVSRASFEAFGRKLDSAAVRHTDRSYPNSTHAFTNPDATATGARFGLPIRYNGAADTASWTDMQAFWRSVFGR